MRKILLVLEDYNELLFLETLLKKVGFDVVSIRNEVSLTEKMMGFSPDLVIATGDGHRISGARVGKKVKKGGNHAKLLLLFPRAKLQSDHLLDSLSADGVVETPLNPRNIILTICGLTGMSPDHVIGKFEKLPIAHDTVTRPEEIQIISSRKAPASGADPADPDRDRVQKYDQLLKDLPASPYNGFSRQSVQAETKEMRDYERTHADVKAIDELRQAFVKALFKK